MWKSYINECNKNSINALQWEFTNFVLERVRSLPGDGDIKKKIENEMDKALYSCQYWWASLDKNNLKFNHGEIYRGAFNMMKILQSTAELSENKYDDIREGEEIFRRLVTELEKERNNKKGAKHG